MSRRSGPGREGASDLERYNVRAYLHRYRDGQPPEARIRLHANDCRQLRVASLLLAGYRDVVPRSVIASSLLDRLVPIVDGPEGLVVHHRDSSPHLAAWLANELKSRTTVKATSTHYVPTRKRR